jgi:hypothetical protein
MPKAKSFGNQVNLTPEGQVLPAGEYICQIIPYWSQKQSDYKVDMIIKTHIQPTEIWIVPSDCETPADQVLPITNYYEILKLSVKNSKAQIKTCLPTNFDPQYVNQV